jgi:hypothetical protein
MFKQVTWDKPSGVRLETLIASDLLESWGLKKVMLRTKNGTFTLYR